MIRYMNSIVYSVVIPHYNSSLLLRRMLNSIPERDDIEVIVVDDCSRLDEREGLKLLKHRNLFVSYLSENHGAGYARNIGIQKMTGKWALIVDADDVFDERAFSVFDKYKDKEIDYLCYCVNTIIPETGESDGSTIVSDESVRAFLKNKDDKNRLLFLYRNTLCWNKMVSIDFIRKNKIEFEPCMVNNDVYFTYMLALRAKKYEVIPDELYHCISVANSITMKPKSIEREFEFYLQAQKRNGFFEHLGMDYYPYYRSDFLYALFLIRKRGLIDMIRFFKYKSRHQKDVREARESYLHLFND